MSIEFRPIKESERDECLALWYTVFSHEWKGFFERYFYGDVEWLPYYTQVAVLDGELVSAVQIVKRTVACGDFRLTMGGIANVATLPDYRGKGYNMELLKRAIAVMEADAMDFSMLGTGINEYYAKLGYSTLARPGWEGEVKPTIAPNHAEYTVRTATSEDLPAIRALYDVYNAKTPIAVQRYEAYWREWMMVTPEKLLPNLLIAENPLGESVGYVSVSMFSGEGNVTGLGLVEFGLKSDVLTESEQKTVAHALISEAIRRDSDATHLRWSNHTDPIVLEALREIWTKERRRDNTGEMVRLLHRTNLMQSFTLAWNERWIAAGRPTGSVAFQTPYGTATIDANGSFLRVAAEENASHALPQETFFGLLFGLVTPETLTDAPETLELLTALFPPCSFVYWNRDGF